MNRPVRQHTRSRNIASEGLFAGPMVRGYAGTSDLELEKFEPANANVREDLDTKHTQWVSVRGQCLTFNVYHSSDESCCGGGHVSATINPKPRWCPMPPPNSLWNSSSMH